MEAIVSKLKEYLAMATEIDFAEFQRYYQQIIDFLGKNYQDLEEEQLLQIRYILNTVDANAGARAARKDANMKKFRKIGEKCRFWSNAIQLKLGNEYGYDQDKLEAADARIDEAMRPA